MKTWAVVSIAVVGVIVSSEAGATSSPPDPLAMAARVGDEPIFLGEIIEGVSSLALVGQEHAGERIGARERLLERLVTARLLYLDGRDRHLDTTSRYAADVRAFADPILAARYLEQLQPQAAAVAVDTALTADAHRQRRDLADTRSREVRDAEVTRLRQATTVAVLPSGFDPQGDRGRDELAAVAVVGGREIAWRQVASALLPLSTIEQRSARLEAIIATFLLADEARQKGLDESDGFKRMLEGFRRRELIKLVREEIVEREGLDDAGVEREYAAHIDNFTFPEQRRVQQIVVRTRPEAEALVSTLTFPPHGVSFYTLARDRSIDPSAKRNLGVLGWVRRAQGSPPLTEVAFSLTPGEISAPVETKAGFHVIRVLDVRPQETVPLDADTRRRIRDRWNANRIQDYANRLAAERYRVEFFPEVYRLGQPAENGGTDS